MQWYRQLGIQHILGFEPFPPAIQRFKEKYGDSIPLVECALSDKDGEQILYQYAPDGSGSSLYPAIVEMTIGVTPGWALDHFGPAYGAKSETLVKVCRFDTFVNDWPKEFPWDQYDCCVMDTQGNEHDILKGMGDKLFQFKYWNIELSRVPGYFGESPAEEVSDWMAERGYRRDSPIEGHNDVFFIRSDLSKNSDRLYRGVA